MSANDPKRTLNARSTVAHCGPRATWQLHSQRLAVVRPSHLALIDHLRRDRNHALARPAEAQIAFRIARAKLDGLQGLALRAERGTSVFRLSCPARGRCRGHEGQAPRRDALAGTCADNAVGRRQRCYGRSLSISALSAASIVRYDASTAITRDPASVIQPVWPARSISAHCSESSRAPRIELVPLIICAARRMFGTSALVAWSGRAARRDGVEVR